MASDCQLQLLVTVKVKNCCLCVLEGKYLCEDEKQGEKRCLRKRKRKESTIHWKEGICAWKRLSVRKKKVCGVWQYISLYFLWRTTGGRFLSLSLSQLSEIEGERARRMCKDVEKGLEMILFPPPPLSLSLFLFLSLSLSYHRCETSKKGPTPPNPLYRVSTRPVKMS